MNFAFIYNPKSKSQQYFVESNAENSDLFFEYFDAIDRFYFKRVESLDWKVELIASQDVSTSNEEYIQWVDLCIDKISKLQFAKVVAAQKQVFDRAQDLMYQQILDELIMKFPDTFVYLLYIDQKIWIGASPEIIGIQERNIFSTISLAGTKLCDEEFSQKEKLEQNIVSNFIENIVQFSTEISSKKINFGHISHLINEYKIEVDDHFDFNQTIHQIHPSPALSGLPKLDSIEFIKQNEPIQRENYCGLISFIENENKYSFATIRCVKITQNQLVFYAGAGITIDSEPQSEWEETNRKIDTIKSVIIK